MSWKKLPKSSFHEIFRMVIEKIEIHFFQIVLVFEILRQIGCSEIKFFQDNLRQCCYSSEYKHEFFFFKVHHYLKMNWSPDFWEDPKFPLNVVLFSNQTLFLIRDNTFQNILATFVTDIQFHFTDFGSFEYF